MRIRMKMRAPTEIKVIKAKYYQITNEIVPLDPQPVRDNQGRWDYQRSGTDEKGEFVVIDFLTEDAVYLEYDATSDKTKEDLQVTTEDEWNRPVTLDIESMEAKLQNDAQTVDVITLQESHTTSLKTSQQTCSTVIERLLLTIVRLFSNAYNAIIKNFRQ